MSMNMSESEQTLDGLAARVVNLSTTLTAALQESNSPLPSFSQDAPESLSPAPEVQGPRLQLIETLMKMLHLATGPSEFMIQQCLFPNVDGLTVDFLNRFGIWHLVPLDGSASYTEIAAAIHLPKQTVRRFLKQAFSMFLFREENPGSDRIVHSAASAYVARDAARSAFIGHCMEDVRPAAAVGVDALQKFYIGLEEHSEEQEHCPTYLASDKGKVRGMSYWEFADTYEEPGKPRGYRAERFALAMKALSQTQLTAQVLEAFDWESLEGATVVDVGGSTGHISALLAKAHPRLKMIVQDLPDIEVTFNEVIASSELRSRISFHAHDFFQPQTLSADAYLFKSIFHDWSDKYVVQILRNLLPVLKSGVHIIIFDNIIPPDYDESGKPIVPLPTRRILGAIDLQMFVNHNSKERNASDWAEVIKRADDRFELNGFHTVIGSPMGIVHVVFKG
ncbi:O-methyltransferase domain-containing protein [Trichoderma ceciliae]